MSKIYQALRKAEREKQSITIQNEPSVEILGVKFPFPEDNISDARDSEEGIERFDLPAKEEESIPVAGNGTVALEQFRKLKTHIFRQVSNPPRCILITSTVPQEGKTLVTMNLAMSIAREIHKKVIVIDADLRHPSIYPIKFRNRKGLSDYLSTDTPISEILKSFSSKKFMIIPAGTPSQKPAELISSKKMRDLLLTLRNLDEDTFILIDSPPILATSEPLMLSEWVDGIIYVIMANQATREIIQNSLNGLIGREGTKKMLGIVFNNKELKPEQIYSDYHYRYYKK
jgi:receptor protein-tyrosine kinase/non-specific protein-tyrosine kinase